MEGIKLSGNSTIEACAKKVAYQIDKVEAMREYAKVCFSTDRGFFFDHHSLDLWVGKDGQLCAKQNLNERLWLQMSGNDLAAIEFDMQKEIQFYSELSGEELERITIRAKNGVFSVKYTLSDNAFGIEADASLQAAILAAKAKAAKYQNIRHRPMPLSNGGVYGARTPIARPVRKATQA